MARWRPGTAVLDPPWATSTTDRQFTVAAVCVKLDPPQARRGRSSPGWTTERLPRLGPVDRGDRVGTHIINKWPEDALKVVGSNVRRPGRRTGTHVIVTYDGAAKAAGVKIYVNGEPQATDDQADAAEGHDPDDGAAEGRPATGRDAVLKDGAIADLRVYDRLLDRGRVAAGSTSRRAAASRRSSGRQSRRRRRGPRCSTWWLVTRDRPIKRPRGRGRPRSSRKTAAIRGRGTIAHVMQEKATPSRRRTSSTAASTTSARDR